MDKNRLFWALAGSFSKFGPVRLKRLSEYFTKGELLFSAPRTEFLKSGLEENLIDEFLSWRPSASIEKLEEKLSSEGLELVLRGDPGYPELLAQIANPPFLLYSKGLMLEGHDNLNLSVVGARKFSTYGRQVTDKLIHDAARAGLTIVSGLALGIDALAHQAALAAQGRTIAVLGSGLDRASRYPASNRYLADKIINEGGQLLSEFTPGTPPLQHHFPQRNRIIAGLSRATLVIEAAIKSGSLITAHQALEQNREVLAVPGNIFSPLSEGTNQLIKLGATPISSYQDILAALDLSEVNQYIDKHAKKESLTGLSPEEKKVISFLNQESQHIDQITAKCCLPASAVSASLTMLELKGLAKNLGSMLYVRT